MANKDFKVKNGLVVGQDLNVSGVIKLNDTTVIDSSGKYTGVDSDILSYLSTNSYATQAYVDSTITSIIDSAYIQARQVDLVRDSAFITGIIDSAYIQARQVDIFRDSGFVTGIIDSAYIQARQVDLVRDSAFITNVIDAAYIQANQVDIFRNSAFVTDIVDAAYIQARDRIRDSNFVTDIIDSAYINSKVIIPDAGVDSAAIIGIIDSAYVQARSPAINSIGDISDVDTTTVEPSNNQVLTWDAVSSLWKPTNLGVSSAGDPYFNNVSLLMKFENIGDPSDLSTAQNSINLRTNGSISNTQSKFGTYSLATSSTATNGAYTSTVTTGSPLDLYTYKPDFTMECWAYPTAYPNGTNEFSGTIMAQGPVGYGAGYAPVSIGMSPAGAFAGQWNIDNTGGGNRTIASAAGQALNQWHHLALCRQGDTMYFFVNGTLINTATETDSFWDGTTGWTFGEGTNSTYRFIGYIDEVRITKGIARYTSNFDIPTASFPTLQRSEFAYDTIASLVDVDTTTVAPLNGQALIWDSSNSVWSPGNVATSGGSGTVDSAQTIALITDTIDSAYIQARQIIGGSGTVDSATITAIVEQEFTAQDRISQTNFKFVADSNQTVFTGLDVNNNTLLIDSSLVTVSVNGVILINGEDYTTTSSSIILQYNANFGDEIYVNTLTSKANISINSYGFSGLDNYIFVADSGQTVFTGYDRDSNLLSLTEGLFSVTVNGIRLLPSDYSSTETTLTLNDARLAQDEVLITQYGFTSSLPISALSTFYYTADSGQTVFTGADNNGNTLSYKAGSIQAYLNGIYLIPTVDYTATNGSSFTLTSAAESSAELVINSIVTAYTQGGSGGTGTVDSAQTIALITDTVDSAYINARVTTGGSGTIPWTEITDSSSILSNSKLIVNTSVKPITLTFPATPSLGDEIKIIDGSGNAYINNITIDLNGNNINGISDDLLIDYDRASITLLYYNPTQGWIISEK